MIILDPPTFSRTKGGAAFHVEKDFEELLRAALEVADRDARILLSTNCETSERAGAGANGAILPEIVAARRALFIDNRRRPIFLREPARASIWLTLR